MEIGEKALVNLANGVDYEPHDLKGLRDFALAISRNLKGIGKESPDSKKAEYLEKLIDCLVIPDQELDYLEKWQLRACIKAAVILYTAYCELCLPVDTAVFKFGNSLVEKFSKGSEAGK